MAVDPELKTVLMELSAGMRTLVEGQGRLEARADKTDEHLVRAASLINALAEGQARLTEGQVKLTERVDKLTERIDAFATMVIRGFTDGAGRDHVIEQRVDELERRVGSLERR